MSNATQRDLHIDQVLSNLIVGRRPEGFIADALLPITPVDKQSDIFYKFRHLEWRLWESGLTARAPGTEARKVGITVTSDGYRAENYALAAEWPVEDEVNADAVLSWAQTNALQLADRLMTDYEMRVAALAVDTLSVSTVHLVNSQWSDPTNSKPLSDLLNLKEVYRTITGQRPNRLVIPESVMSKLQLNDQIRDIVYGSNNGGLVTAQQIGSLVGVDQVLVPYSMVNTATDKATELGSGTLSDIWGKNVYFAKVNLLQGRMIDTWINAFRWTSPLFGQPMVVQRWPFDVKRKVYGIEASYYQTEKVISPDLGLRVGSVIA
jgi:hypothetical protein